MDVLHLDPTSTTMLADTSPVLVGRINKAENWRCPVCRLYTYSKGTGSKPPKNIRHHSRCAVYLAQQQLEGYHDQPHS